MTRATPGEFVARFLGPGFDGEVDAWTTGNVNGLRHERYIASGGFGEVHKVSIA